MNCIAQVEVLGQCCQISDPVVHVVAGADLGGPTVPTPVVRDHPVAVVKEEQHLGVPVVGREGPAVAEDDRLPGTPILVEDLDIIRCGED